MAATNVSKIYVENDDKLTCFAGAAVLGSRFVKVSASGTPTVNGNKPTVIQGTSAARGMGVAWADQSTVGGDVEVVTEGIIGVLASGAITAGDSIMSGSAGQAMTATSTNFVYGVATATVADGAICPVLLQGL